MAASILYRLLLLGLLPLGAIVLFVEGQNYDPSFIQFQSSGSAPNPMASFFPAEIADYNRIGQIRTYERENLYEYVNGHAEYFISAGFSTLAVAEYGVTGSEGEEPDAVIDIYDMGKSIQAFGILSDESGGKTYQLQTGVTGFRTQQGISFVKGQYYVRISAFNENVSPAIFTEEIDRRIGTDTDPFPEFARLPEIGEVLQTRFIREAYRGLDFVNNIVEREYRVNGEHIQLFLFTGDEDDIRKLVRAFMDYFRQSEVEYDTIEKMGKTIYEVRDPYEGDWMLIPLSDSLFGVYGSYDDNIISKLLKGSHDINSSES